MKTKIGIILFLVLGFVMFLLISNNRKLRDELEISKTKTDTVLVDKIIEVPKPYNVYQKPEKVIKYLPDTLTEYYKEMYLRQKHIVLMSSQIGISGSKDSLVISKLFLTQYPTNPKLISLSTTDKELKIQILPINGIPQEEVYKVNYSSYNYRYSNGKLTNKRVTRFHIQPEVSYSYRLLNKLHDLDFNLNIKTTNFNYKVGANTFYYPQFGQSGLDAKFTLQYNF